MTMSEHPAANVQFCDEYEDLFHKCLQALTRWTQLRGLDGRPGPVETPASSEVRRAEHHYVTAFSALRAHSRTCVLCEETLRAHLKGASGAQAYRVS
jgi:hypothetical protein